MLTVVEWDALSASAAQDHARALVPKLPAGFSFGGLERASCGERTHLVAKFLHGEARFSLVPGGAATLGLDVADLHLGEDARESWRGSQEEYGIGESIEELVESLTLRPREVTLPALLVEESADEIGWERIAPDDPVMKQLERDVGQGSTRIYQGGEMVEATRRGGKLVARRTRKMTHAELAASLARDGFRLPTSDEWEHANGAGARTLFRWGDTAPFDRYPIDDTPTFDLHRRFNAFGLVFSSDPYENEVVAEPDTTRGGDGGSAICGGAGFFLGWLPLATAYFDRDTCTREPGSALSAGYTIARRVLEVP